jgi:hypothetical protein
MKIFFDTEFTGLRKDTTLISIGMIAENGETFYAELNDYNEKLCNRWIEDNVLKNLLTRYLRGIEDKPFVKNVHVGDKTSVAKALYMWLKQFDYVQFVSDVCHYDMVLLIDLFGCAFDLPKNVSAVCYDINQDIAKHYEITDAEAFDKSREEIVQELCGTEIDGVKHNALYDAMVIKAIYEELN